MSDKKDAYSEDWKYQIPSQIPPLAVRQDAAAACGLTDDLKVSDDGVLSQFRNRLRIIYALIDHRHDHGGQAGRTLLFHLHSLNNHDKGQSRHPLFAGNSCNRGK